MQKSKAWLGVLTGLQRARVSELVSDDYERPANPPQRVPSKHFGFTNFQSTRHSSCHEHHVEDSLGNIRIH